MSLKIARESIEYLKTTITSDVSPGGLPEFAFTDGADDTDRPATWIGGVWTDTATLVGTTYTRPARTPLIGAPAGIDLEPGFYAVWVRITDTPEIPVERIDYLTIT